MKELIEVLNNTEENRVIFYSIVFLWFSSIVLNSLVSIIKTFHDKK